MSYKYSKITGCFYPVWAHYATLPGDLIPATEEEFELMMNRTPDMRITVINGKVALEKIPDAPLLERQAQVWQQIKADRTKRREGGFKVEVSPGAFKWFHSDEPSRLQQTKMILAGTGLPAIPWKTMDGTFITLTPAIATAIAQADFTLDTALFTRAEQHKAIMEASPDPAAYDYSTGWPENFLGL